MTIENKIIDGLLDKKAIFLSVDDPFTWASGIKSPIYTDLRLINSYPVLREYIENSMVKMIKQHYPGVDYIVGTSTAGISHAAIIAHKMKLPMAYVKSQAKDHGRKKNIEGIIFNNAKTVIIEDLMSTGKSSIEVVKIVQAAGFEVLGIASIFNYNLDAATKNLLDARVKNYSLANFNTLIKKAIKTKYISQKNYEKLLKFQKDPTKSDWML